MDMHDEVQVVGKEGVGGESVVYQWELLCVVFSHTQVSSQDNTLSRAYC